MDGVLGASRSPLHTSSYFHCCSSCILCNILQNRQVSLSTPVSLSSVSCSSKLIKLKQEVIWKPLIYTWAEAQVTICYLKLASEVGGSLKGLSPQSAGSDAISLKTEFKLRENIESWYQMENLLENPDSSECRVIPHKHLWSQTCSVL